MKKTHLFYGIVILAVVGFLAGLIGYTTDTPHTQPPEPVAPVARITPTQTPQSTQVKEKSCDCCAERLARLRKRYQDLRARIQKAQHAENATHSPRTP